jgi:hypothetical protein
VQVAALQRDVVSHDVQTKLTQVDVLQSESRAQAFPSQREPVAVESQEEH